MVVGRQASGHCVNICERCFAERACGCPNRQKHMLYRIAAHGDGIHDLLDKEDTKSEDTLVSIAEVSREDSVALPLHMSKKKPEKKRSFWRLGQRNKDKVIKQ